MRRPTVRVQRAGLAVIVAAAAATGVIAGYGPERTAQRHPVTTVTHPTRRRRAPAPRVLLRLPRTPPNTTLTLPILMYHRIGTITASQPAITRALTVAPREFALQMRWLVQHGYHAVTPARVFAALERHGSLPSKPLMITFDDGYRDVLWNAAPVLRRLDLPAVAYVITGRVSGPDSSFLTWGELPMLEADGVTIGSHTVDHVELPSLDDARASWELRQSRLQLERHLHHPVQWFSYPAGAATPHTVTLVRRAGFVLAVTTRPGDVQHAADALTLHRTEILGTTSLGTFATLVTAGGPYAAHG